MSIWEVIKGKAKRKYLNATDIQVLDVANRFRHKNLERVLNEIGTGSAQSVSNLEHRVNQISSPNLLINSDFRNPVNQRVQTTYSDNSKYTVDRWLLVNWSDVSNSSVGDVKVIENGISLSNFDSQLYLVQAMENDLAKKLRGRTITLSAKVKASNITKGSFFIQVNSHEVANKIDLSKNLSSSKQVLNYKDMDKEGNILIAIPYVVPEEAETIQVEFGCHTGIGEGMPNSDCLINVEWIKLEIGDKATPFIPRSYGEERAICQRYYEEVGFSERFLCDIPDNIDYELNEPFKVTKRTVPTQKITHVSIDDADVSLNTIKLYNSGLSYFSAFIETKSNETKGKYKAGSRIVYHGIADAEIY